MGTCLITWRMRSNRPVILLLWFSNFYSFLTSENLHCFLMSYTTKLAFLNVCSRKIFMLSCLSCCWNSVFDPRSVYLVHKDSVSHSSHPTPPSLSLSSSLTLSLSFFPSNKRSITLQPPYFPWGPENLLRHLDYFSHIFKFNLIVVEHRFLYFKIILAFKALFFASTIK